MADAALLLNIFCCYGVLGCCIGPALGRKEESGGGGGGKGILAMASSSAGNQSPMPKRGVPNYVPYPPPLARYEDVVISPKLFMNSFENLHATMGTMFM
ncbi:hypothetical protein U1Q18_000623 [Sarracenia purpurea var. burkii]